MPETHAHKLKRLRYKSGNTIYFCMLPDCKYKSAPALVLGKRALCWRCGNEFLMNEYSIRLAKPHCENCHQSKNGSVPLGVTDQVPIVDSSESLMDRLKHAIDHAEEDI